MRIAVYCGAHLGADPAYQKAAQELGEWLVAHDYELIYGGSKLGLMGVVADSVLNKGGTAIGIMPKFLSDRERVHPGLTQILTVADLDERKKMMMQEADVCLALPGGVGTLEEISEAYSWMRVGQTHNPCIFFDVKNYYYLLQAFFDQMVKQDFLSQKDRQLVLFSESLFEIDTFIHNYYQNNI
ncbi:TIGR00730 family Rossman fold protein [Enterococcus dongliensis]|uniref:Cytokinin riboside 5'-monophosphate phosphoribohydrolase n=1 Tax=Enterococcus dongliensis TaxID=2559925 RepID=A0AAP5NBJ9_9ENTE|nr:TIGR00730 family Rossman fold protein [Enterococcus dongliensis]MDT2596169.1 TIGR00730 family Rossman fold protein [Enterococcus dongliensis]MDT2603889.1 TIGR00730 family Rossman fold protein [Enterococcus dongliensis]MDT2634214.1 TIGR00730 family Rossman fold protein [Enterococcus dongliensis]MDT2637144.1 TIGR00730 family Rossman fold protein [Enterococcus dongliensis]MDT2642443.1 TIGR00730 family Rossman fold protein [Enterococcus dongliensis]